MKIMWDKLLASVLLSLGTGTIAGLLTRGNMDIYSSINTPALSPPSWLFPVVWTILYILMGIAAYLVYISDSEYRGTALLVYIFQLAVNFMWPLIFFNMRAFLLAFIVLVILWLLIIITIWLFSRVNKTAVILFIPYLLWVTFAGYLNLSIYLLNR